MPTIFKTQVCVAGGGPAGIMAGFLLARAGAGVTVLEKHADFLRDFRGDTIHPSTMQVMHELGLLEQFLMLPHQRTPQLNARFGSEKITIADFTHLPAAAPFVALMPQWDFLDFIAAQARQLPNFRLLMATEAAGTLRDGERVTGVAARGTDGAFEIHAGLTIAADGRSSMLRHDAGLKVDDFGAPMDVLWFRLPRHGDDSGETMGRFDPGHIFIMLNRGDYWQCALVIAKGANDAMRKAGLEAFRARLRPLLPFASSRADEIKDWDQVKLLVVQVNRVRQWWKPGLLCIGDAAHAMSPVGGVGVNLAIQDAVATANILHEPVRAGMLHESHLAAVQARREFPTRVTQRLQLLIQDKIIAATLQAKGEAAPPLPMRLMGWVPGLNRLPARVIGLGIRPEHVAPALRGRR